MRRVLLVSAIFLVSGFVAATKAGHAAESYRPQFHFSPQKNWTNDPNGLVYFEGEFHLFFQYNPFGDEWGHMSWGHAVSRDLIHWQQLPVAIPESDGIMIFTGSTVIDHNNSSGFCLNGQPCMVAIYTGFTPEAKGRKSLQTQNIAYSNDRGRTWTKYSGNPVIDLHMTDFRDPKVLWSTQSKQWVMAVSLPDDHQVAMYGSPDLKHWSEISRFGPAGAASGQWECPELFELPVEGTKESRWVLKVGLNPGALQGGSGEQYFIGQFDGKQFKNDNPASLALWTDYGKDCYCALTFNNLPKTHSPVMIGWMDNWQYAAQLPTSPWRGQMTLPRKLSLRKTADGIRLFQAPIDELDSIKAGGATVSETSEQSFNNAFAKTKLIREHSYRLRSRIDPGSATEIGWRILSDDAHYTQIGYNKDKSVVYVDRTNSGLVNFSKDFPGRIEAPMKASGAVTFDLVVDKLSVELFAGNGAVTMTDLVFPESGASKITFFSNGAAVKSVSAELTDLNAGK